MLISTQFFLFVLLCSVINFQVEEIDEIECNFSNPFYADAVAKGKDTDLAKEHRIHFRIKEKPNVNDNGYGSWKLLKVPAIKCAPGKN